MKKTPLYRECAQNLRQELLFNSENCDYNKTRKGVSSSSRKESLDGMILAIGPSGGVIA